MSRIAGGPESLRSSPTTMSVVTVMGCGSVTMIGYDKMLPSRRGSRSIPSVVDTSVFSRSPLRRREPYSPRAGRVHKGEGE